MDFKCIGMNWYANLCEKLETVRIEVEDKVQETKFVECVQTGCLHVNKCFAELRQELFSSSCKAPVQEKVSDSSALGKANTNDINGSQKESGDIPTMGKDLCPSSNLPEDGDLYASLPPSSVNSTRCMDSVNLLDGDDVFNILKPTPEGSSSPKNEKQASYLLSENSKNVVEGSYKKLGGLSSVPKDSCPLSNLFPDCPPSSISSKRCSDSMETLKGKDAANIFEPMTEHNSVVDNEKYAPCNSEEVVPSMSEVSLSCSPQTTAHLDTEISYSAMKRVGFNLSIKESEDTLIHNQSSIGQDENTGNADPTAVEALAMLSALNDMSASSFFSELSNSDHEKIFIVPPINVRQRGSVEVTEHESCSHCEVGGDDFVDGTRCSTDVMCSLSTYCMDPPVLQTDSVEDTGHESGPQSGLNCENAVNSSKYGSDISNPLSASYMESPVTLYEHLVSGFLPSNDISPTLPEGSADSNAAEPFMEDVEQFDNVKLRDSCIVIDNKDLVITPRSNKRRSLMKKFQSALASRRRTTKQREYEQLAILYSGIDAEINLRRETSLPAEDLHLMKSAHELSEPDWELV